MTDNGQRPWWYSGDEEQPEDPQPRTESAASGLGDWTALLSGATRMIDWATSAVMAPHAEHVDPADHPTCVVCRTITLVGDPTGLIPGGTSAAPPAEPRQAPTVRWIPIRDEDGPASR